MSVDRVRDVIEQCLKKYPCDVDVRFNEPMKDHTTFKVGGLADCWICPFGEGFPTFCLELVKLAENKNIPVFFLGGGANIVVSDKGIRGIVLDMGKWSGKTNYPDQGKYELILKSGTCIDEAVEIAASEGLTGLEFLAGMPGTIGGAVWMNARCYGCEAADFLSRVEITGFSSESKWISFDNTQEKTGFGYKVSPFQKMNVLILNAAFKLKKGNIKNIKTKMNENRQDRKNKGQYLFPCAGSVFKNNRLFGKPTGAIIDQLGMKGLRCGGAQIAPFHGNIIINTGGANASDIKTLTDETAERVKNETGFILEPEILFVGDWK